MKRMNRRDLFSMVAAAVMLILVAGCGSSGPRSGTVFFTDGSPVRSGSIEFRNVKDKQRFAGRIDTEGGFVPASDGGRVGLPPGDYEVVVVQIVLTEDLALAQHSHGGTVPRRYADYYTTDLRHTVKSGDTDPVKIVVEAEKVDEE
ncbi:MAG: hypothetical protein AAFP90_15765, partial [Planctomycetota bacterium]